MSTCSINYNTLTSKRIIIYRRIPHECWTHISNVLVERSAPTFETDANYVDKRKAFNYTYVMYFVDTFARRLILELYDRMKTN